METPGRLKRESMTQRPTEQSTDRPTEQPNHTPNNRPTEPPNDRPTDKPVEQYFLLWCSLFVNFTQFVILDNLLILDLAALGVKGLRRAGRRTRGDGHLLLSFPKVTLKILLWLSISDYFTPDSFPVVFFITLRGSTETTGN